MKLSISNIAWPQDEDDFYLKIVRSVGAFGVEVAASKVWPEPVDVRRRDRRDYGRKIFDYGLKVCAIQALLFTRRDLGLFKGDEITGATVEYLKHTCTVASDLGAGVLVYGSPASRLRWGLSNESAMEKAVRIFREIGETAQDEGVCFCIEPLGASETDFINTVEEGVLLVKAVDSPGFGLHIDSKALGEEAGDLVETMSHAVPHANHFHISEPDLAVPGDSGMLDHGVMGRNLCSLGYDKYVSIEMKMQPDCESAVRTALSKSLKWYIEPCKQGEDRNDRA